MAEKAGSGDSGASNGSNKRSSLMSAPAKGILKSSQSADTPQQAQAADSSFLVPGEVQLPTRIVSRAEILDGNNTTSRINTLALQDKANRRVSFAPDVTLHSFDFIPETKKSLREPRRRTNEVFVTSTQNEEPPNDIVDESMDLTSPVAISKQPYKSVSEQELSMEITQPFTKHDNVPTTEHEETMEFTAVQDPSNQAIPDQSTMEITEVHSYNPQPETKVPETPPSSKRRKLNDPVNVEPASDDSEEQDMELSLMEKLSPIRLSPVGPHVAETEKKESYSLHEFMESTGLSFFIDTELLEKSTKPIVFETIETSQPQNLRLNQVLNILYLDTPMLEMSAFICKELLHRIEQSEKQFKELDHQINTTSPPPLLLSEYFNSSNDIKQSMNQQLQLVKSFSKLKAKKSWYEWRVQHLNSIKIVLEENLALLREENTKVELELTKAREIRAKAVALREAIRKEIMILKELPPEAFQEEKRLDEKLGVELLKQQLALHSVDVTDAEALTEEKDKLKKKIASKEAELLALKNEIKVLSRSSLTKSKKLNFTDYDIRKYGAKLDMLGQISGVEFVNYKKSELTIRFAWLETLQSFSINLSNLNSSTLKPYTVTGPNDVTFIFDYCYEKAVKDNSEVFPRRSLTIYLEIAKQSHNLFKAYTLLRLLFPVDIQKIDNVRVLSIKDFDLNTNAKTIYHLDLKDFFSAALGGTGDLRVRTTVIQKSHSSTTAFLKKVAKILPWFTESRVVFSDSANT